ncbi:uncharacterized protein [Drosophila takahashii]|uniref:uncharacterized protein n=1 Tax=Drosophila takahashii TaxID=29030 RepID=UPI003898FD30
MKAHALIVIFSLMLLMLACANAESSTTTEAPTTTTESPSVPQWSWTDFIKFFNGSSSGNKFYFFF